MNAALNNRIKSMVFQNVARERVPSIQMTNTRSGVFNVVLDVGIDRGIIFRAHFKRADVYRLLALWDDPVWDTSGSYLSKARHGYDFDSSGETRSEPLRSVRTRFEYVAGPRGFMGAPCQA